MAMQSCDLLGTTVPPIQAPMAGALGSLPAPELLPQVVAAVCVPVVAAADIADDAVLRAAAGPTRRLSAAFH